MLLPLVSIIIPTYNSAHLIGDTLKSVLLQDYAYWECIIIDDGSTDQTNTIVEPWLAKDTRFSFIRIDNAGASHARNVGLRKSKGAYIQFLDADDILHPEKITLQVREMQHTEADISFSLWSYFEHSIEYATPFKFSEVPYSIPNTGLEMLTSFGMHHWFMPPIAWLTKRSVIEQAGLWNIHLCNNDDGEYFTRVLINCKKLICIDKVLAYYRQVITANSLSKLNTVKKIDSAYKSYGLILTHLQPFGKMALSYPKRLYYMQYIMIKGTYPKLAKRAAKGFDAIDSPSFLMKKKRYWYFVQGLGLYNGTKVYKFLLKIYVFFKG
ncbi:glycosyltransferase family 2 protein [Aestuariibaculum sp. M13]|uniref:glycosyltransferase family 2 protein n=1 Tax=Aestuariibaculum sp. M13 TaxID=2967132 RepID=UPI002159DF21|nr:glycosyltransferase family 2 protein [Aestuariibaculum sp. M13]MCR8666365.1 glycosyltransferase family 2 protein [Aestuariibaculum sp. M13]